MTPEEEKRIYQAIHEAVQKRIHLEKEKSYKEGWEIGRKEGWEIGRKEGRTLGRKIGRKIRKRQRRIEIAKKLKDYDLTIQEIAKITELPISTVKKL